MFASGAKGWDGRAAPSVTFPPRLHPGPEITDELVRVLRRRLDEATLDVITVMLVRNCKLTPADVEVSSSRAQRPSVTLPRPQGRSLPGPPPSALTPHPPLQFIQPPGSLPSEVLHLALPASCRPWLPALAWYLRQNLLVFLHSPKYTDSNSRNHFQVRRPPPLHPYCVAVSHRCPPPHTTFAHGPGHTCAPTLLSTCVCRCLHIHLSPIPCGGHLFPDGFGPLAWS